MRFMNKLARRMADRFFGDLARRSDLDNLYNQLAAYIQIHGIVAGSSLLGPLRGWAISPDAMVHILADLERHKSPTVVEFGSGESTVILASALARKKDGRLYTIEHDRDFFDRLQKRVEAAGLHEWVEFHHAPLRWKRNDSWNLADAEIDLSGVPQLSIDMAIIDGPPGNRAIDVPAGELHGGVARYPPLKWALEHLNSGGVVFLDDAKRPAEQLFVGKAIDEFPGLMSEMIWTEKGLARLTLPLREQKTRGARRLAM